MDKVELRRSMSGLGAIDPESQGAVVSALGEWLASRLPGTVSAYLALPDEVDLSPLFDLLPGWRWVLPRVGDDKILTFRDRDVARETHPFGMEQPVAEGVVTSIHDIDTFLVPGLAFDSTGGRLGRGGGFYDRVLPRRRADALAIAVTTRAHVVDSVPMEPHDHRVDWLATEDGVIRCPTTR